MISKKARYGLRAMLRLARDYGRGPILIADLATQEGIPKKFLEFILLELKQQGMLQSKKGKGGGYLLARRPEEISAGSVIRALDGGLAPLPCVGDVRAEVCAECREASSCRIRALMSEVDQATTQILDAATLEELSRRGENGRDRASPQRYHI
jgi:Rrf2 family protein